MQNTAIPNTMEQRRPFDDIPRVVYQKLRNLIITGELAPGSRIKQVHMAKTLKVSQTPVREAIRMLEQDGWLQSDYCKGSIVTKFTLQDIMDGYEVRELLEGFVVRKAASMLTDEQLTHLRKVAEKADEEFKYGLETKTDDYDKYDLDFHLTVTQFVGNKQIIQIFERLRKLEIFMVASSAPHRVADIRTKHGPSHMDIVEAIAKRDPEWAEAVARHHVRVSRSLLESEDSTFDRITSNGKHYTVVKTDGKPDQAK